MCCLETLIYMFNDKRNNTFRNACITTITVIGIPTIVILIGMIGSYFEIDITNSTKYYNKNFTVLIFLCAINGIILSMIIIGNMLILVFIFLGLKEIYQTICDIIKQYRQTREIIERARLATIIREIKQE